MTAVRAAASSCGFASSVALPTRSLIVCPSSRTSGNRASVANSRGQLWQACASQQARLPEVPPLLEVRDLEYTVPVDSRLRLLRGANLAVHDNEFVLIIGENGTGKSTLLSLIIGFEEPVSGKILMRGKKLKSRVRTQSIAMVMQRPSDYFLGRSVLEELVIGHDAATPADVRQVLFDVGLQNISLLQRPDELSGGQMRRLSIAVQLMRTRVGRHKPELFLLDEPMAGVDVEGRRQLAELLSSLTEKFALVVISHQPAELLEYADRVVQLARGHLVEVNPRVIHRAIKINAERARNEGRS